MYILAGYELLLPMETSNKFVLLMHGVPVMALTATATHDMMKSIALALGMYQCTVVKRSCNWPNTYYEFKECKILQSLKSERTTWGIFGGIVSDLKTNGDAASSDYFLFEEWFCIDLWILPSQSRISKPSQHVYKHYWWYLQKIHHESVLQSSE